MLIAVIGLGTFGSKTAISLSERGADVIAIDKRSDVVEKIKDRVTHAIELDVTDERSVRSANLSDADVAIVGIGDSIEQSILAVAMLRKMGVGRVIARAISPLHEHVLNEIGASEIIKVEEEMGEIIASKIIAPYVLQRYNFASGYSLVELKLGKKFEGKTLVESKIRQNFNLNIVALQKRVPIISEDGKPEFKVEINDTPMPMDIIESDDIVVLVGSEKNFNMLFTEIGES